MLSNKFAASTSVHAQDKFETINHKYATGCSRNSFKEPKRDANYAKYCFYARGPFIWNRFLNETEKGH